MPLNNRCPLAVTFITAPRFVGRMGVRSNQLGTGAKPITCGRGDLRATVQSLRTDQIESIGDPLSHQAANGGGVSIRVNWL